LEGLLGAGWLGCAEGTTPVTCAEATRMGGEKLPEARCTTPPCWTKEAPTGRAALTTGLAAAPETNRGAEP